MRIEYTSQFARQYRKLPLDIKQAAEKQEQIFRKNPKDSRLKTHQLKGNLKKLKSFLVTHKYRVFFEFTDKKTVLFHKVGDHQVYR